MIEESLLKTNFIGRDGFRWWIGQVPPNETDFVDQSNGGGWGNRVKVRILGYHPYSEIDLPNKDLPWAIVMLGATDGSGAGNKGVSMKIAPGDTVLGFFLDGDNAQQPVVMGVLGRTSQVPAADFASPFVPFTGYTDNIKNDGAFMPTSQSNEFGNAGSQKHVRSVSQETAEKIEAQTNPEGDPAKKEISSAKNLIGQKVKIATDDADSAISQIKIEVENFVSTVKNITDNVSNAVAGAKQFLDGAIDSVTAGIQKGASRIIGDMTTNLSNALEPVLNKGLEGLYQAQYAITLAATANPVIADIVGTITQALMIKPVKELSDAIPCIANKVLNGMGDIIKGILQNVADNVKNFVSCIGDQVVGGLMNVITNQVSKFLEPFMAAFTAVDIFDILGGFSPLGFLSETADAILSVGKRLGCEEIAPEQDLAGDVWTIGKGLGEKSGIPVDEILETANIAQGLADLAINTVQDIAADTGSLGFFDFANPSVGDPSFTSALGKCYAGPPELGGCGGTKVKIFGGGIKGIGGVANAIVQVAEGGRGVTGSLLGVDLVNGGGGYTFPPFVEIVDECKRGYGATARAIIDYDEDSSTYQQITDIVLVTNGENYTPNVETSDNDYVAPIPTIVRPGSGYDPAEDTVIDTNGDVYEIEVDVNGGIIGVIKVPEIIRDPETGEVSEEMKFPSIDAPLEYTVKSRRGSGALLEPKLIVRPEDPQGLVRQVIDCISNDDNLVGYVNGKPYYGPFHVHPTTGRKMVGAKHVSTPHQYIYNSQSESLAASTPVSTTTEIIQTPTTTETATETTTTTTSTTPTPTTTTSSVPTPSPTPTPTPTPPPSPPPTPTPTPPPSQGGGSYGGGY